MTTFRLEKSRDGWIINDDDGARATMRDLDWAAYLALTFAERSGSPAPTLGEGVPDDALEQGARLGEILNGRR